MQAANKSTHQIQFKTSVTKHLGMLTSLLSQPQWRAAIEGLFMQLCTNVSQVS
jgi:hypothetical protein